MHRRTFGFMHRTLARVITAVALGAALAGGGAFALASSGAPATHAAVATTIPAGTIHGCIVLNGSRQLEDVYLSSTAGTTCPKNTVQAIWSVTGPAGPKGATGATGPAGPQGPAGPAGGPLTVTSVINVSNDPDSSSNAEPSDSGFPAGTWAVDTLTETWSVTRHSAVDASDCGPSAVTCYFYTGSVSDTGTFASLAGANSPGDKDVPITGTVSGSINGGSSFQFYATSSDLKPSATTTINNTDDAVFDGTSDTYWPSLFVPGVADSTYSLLNSWGWTYVNSACPSQTWVNAAAGNSGDVTGAACTS
jgi:hypothetical protein